MSVIGWLHHLADEPDARVQNDDSSNWSGQSSSSFDDSDDQSGNTSDSQQGASGGQRSSRSEPCRFYNGSGCRNGSKCPDLHVCKFSWKGSCRNGHRCRLRHMADSDSDDNDAGRRGVDGRGGRRTPGRGNDRRPPRRSASSGGEAEDDVVQGPYQWQLHCGRGWKNIENDHILEAQYSRPCTKGIKIYNTAHGAISIDFKHMRVLKKTNLKVRRRDTQQTEWLWYHRGHQRWHQYGEKDSKGNVHTMKSSVLEAEYQKDKKGTYQFSIGSDNYEIKFKDMCQISLSSGKKRKMRRRPMYKSSQGQRGLTSRIRNMNLSSPPRDPKWQFSGRGNQWYDFKNRVGSDTECSVTSANIEAEYQRDPHGTMTFIVSGDTYELDFSAMTQTNMTTSRTRKIRRI
ncbi:hypothetical protein ACEWY4_009334 [Coilia grayii]|uniref:Uncharacterized protein n=1 Tax=Coilia grayii TaxID=363190 RepID=A0ABD1K646_9TELE